MKPGGYYRVHPTQKPFLGCFKSPVLLHRIFVSRLIDGEKDTKPLLDCIPEDIIILLTSYLVSYQNLSNDFKDVKSIAKLTSLNNKLV